MRVWVRSPGSSNICVCEFRLEFLLYLKKKKKGFFGAKIRCVADTGNLRQLLAKETHTNTFASSLGAKIQCDVGRSEYHAIRETHQPSLPREFN